MTASFGPIPVHDKLNLRLLVPDDAAEIFKILQKDPKIQQRYVTWTAGLKSEDDVRQAINNYKNTRSLFAITDDSKLIGYIGIWKILDESNKGSDRQEYDMGYFIDPDRRGQGIVPAAATALLNEASKRLSMNLVVMYIWDENEPSKSVARKLGFRPTETQAFEPLLDVMERRWELVIQ